MITHTQLTDAIKKTDTAEGAAHLLSISKSTLFRLLRREGTSYKTIKQHKVIVPKEKGFVDELIAFIEAKGFQVYKMQVDMEAYQVQTDNETIRFYVQKYNR